MMKRRLSALVALVILCLAAVAVAAESDWYYANLDTMPRLPTNKLFYLEQKAGQCPKPTPDGESLNVRMVGK